MNKEQAMQVRLQPAILPLDLKGRKTVPAVGLSDAGFTYTPAIKTNLSETFARALSQLGERKVEKAA